METFFHKLKDLRNSGKRYLVIKLVDLFDFNGSFVPNFSQVVGSNPVILVGNKVDLLPSRVSRERVKQWLFREAKKKGLDVKDVFLISSKSGSGIQKLVDEIPKLRKGLDIYVMGTSNSGKSTFLNWILDNAVEDPSDSKPVISFLPGTTLNLISIPLKEGYIYDTPGIHNKHHVANLLTPKEIKFVTPTKAIQPVNYTLSPGKTIFLAGLGRIDHLSGPEVVFTVFVSNALYIHSTSTSNADDLFQRHQGNMLSPPIQRQLEEPFVYHDLNLEGDNWRTPFVDIVFPGLGWIALATKGKIRIRVWSPKSVGYSIRESPLLPFEKPKSGKLRKVRPISANQKK